jgi:hypothetical protein
LLKGYNPGRPFILDVDLILTEAVKTCNDRGCIVGKGDQLFFCYLVGIEGVGRLQIVDLINLEVEVDDPL